ncbi:MAG: hypothetical protein GY810_06795 [Aureispira sp.]|nr:hypothetical protein [Aureispira sp.]
MQIKLTLLLVFLLGSINGQAQSKKELLKKYNELQKSNLKLETANSALTVKVEVLTESLERLEKDWDALKISEQEALVAKNKAITAQNEALKAKEIAIQAQIEAMRAKEAVMEEKQRMEEIFAKAVKGKSSLRKMSIAGRYIPEKKDDKTGDYIDLYEDGTLLLAMNKNNEDSKLPMNSVTGTYKLKGKRITLILSLFTMTNAVDGTLEGDRLVVIEKGKETVYLREK